VNIGIINQLMISIESKIYDAGITGISNKDEFRSFLMIKQGSI
jgi:hypothetical protein